MANLNPEKNDRLADSSAKNLVIAARPSPLAKGQAQMIGAQLESLGYSIDYLWITSQGDRFAGRLSEAGGKGLFTSCVEQVLLRGEADIAVHSLKDLPCDEAELNADLILAAIPERENVADVLISRHAVNCVTDLPQGARVGTASPRRQAQVLALRSDLKVELLRGNVGTRLQAAT